MNVPYFSESIVSQIYFELASITHNQSSIFLGFTVNEQIAGPMCDHGQRLIIFGLVPPIFLS